MPIFLLFYPSTHPVCLNRTQSRPFAGSRIGMLERVLSLVDIRSAPMEHLTAGDAGRMRRVSSGVKNVVDSQISMWSNGKHFWTHPSRFCQWSGPANRVLVNRAKHWIKEASKKQKTPIVEWVHELARLENPNVFLALNDIFPRRRCRECGAFTGTSYRICSHCRTFGYRQMVSKKQIMDMYDAGEIYPRHDRTKRRKVLGLIGDTGMMRNEWNRPFRLHGSCFVYNLHTIKSLDLECIELCRKQGRRRF